MKKKFWIIGGSIVVIIAVASILANQGNQQKYETENVRRQDLQQEVSVTGKVEAAQEVDLALERSGRVSSVQTAVGKQVVAGAILVSLDSGDLVASVRQAEASLESARAQLLQYQAALANQQAKLDELQKGARPEDVTLKQADVNKAQQDLDNYYQQVSTTLSDAYAKADDSVRSKTSGIFLGSASEAYSLSFSSCESQLSADTTWKRGVSERDLQLWNTQLTALAGVTAQAELDQAILTAKGHIAISKDFIADLGQLLSAPCSLTDASLDTYRTNINTARASLNTAQSSINTLQQSLASQKLVVTKAQDELTKTLAGSTVEQISAQQATVQQAQANVAGQQAQIKGAEASRQNYQAQLGKNIIRAPFSGLVTKQEAKVGQIAQAGVALVSLISEKKYQVKANVPEADITKLKLENKATITLDAYGSEVEFVATVVAIDPAETIVDGVSTYRVTFEFSQDDERVKSGMTANITVLTDSRTQVLAIPQRAITTEETKKVVNVLVGTGDKQMLQQKEVVTGLVGSNGQIEIISGLQEGDAVVTSQIK